MPEQPEPANVFYTADLFVRYLSEQHVEPIAGQLVLAAVRSPASGISPGEGIGIIGFLRLVGMASSLIVMMTVRCTGLCAISGCMARRLAESDDGCYVTKRGDTCR